VYSCKVIGNIIMWHFQWTLQFFENIALGT